MIQKWSFTAPSNKNAPPSPRIINDGRCRHRLVVVPKQQQLWLLLVLITVSQLCTVIDSFSSSHTYQLPTQQKQQQRHESSNSAVTTTQLYGKYPSKRMNTNIPPPPPKVGIDDNTNYDESRNWIEKITTQQQEEETSSSSQQQEVDDNDKDENPLLLDDDNVEYYNLGLSGDTFQIGSLSQRIYDALKIRYLSSSSSSQGGEGGEGGEIMDTTNNELQKILQLYAMDFTAKEATRVALKQQYGLELLSKEDEDDEVGGEDLGTWCGTIDTIRLLNDNNNKIYNSLEEVVADWIPGQSFDFVVRRVPAKPRELSMEEVLQALDPKGELQREAEERNNSQQQQQQLSDMTNNEDDEDDLFLFQQKQKQLELEQQEALAAIFDESEEETISRFQTLSDMVQDNIDRTKQTPILVATNNDGDGDGIDDSQEQKIYTGIDTDKGYNIISRNTLLLSKRNKDGIEHPKTLMHVMDAFVSHGVLIVDVTNGGTNFTDAVQLADMWKSTQSFFERTAATPTLEESLQPMQTIPEAGSIHAKIGYVNHDHGSLRFLETRTEYESQRLLPILGEEILTNTDVGALQKAFQTIAGVGKDVIRISTSASSIANGAFSMSSSGGNSGPNKKKKRRHLNRSEAEAEASRCALLMANELIDDGMPLPSTSDLEIEHSSLGSVSMSPHRLCQYSDERPQTTSGGGTASAREIFGAHVDSSFVTIVPVAAVSGLEVFDEAAEKWYRPELRARRHWEQGQLSVGKDPNALVETIELPSNSDSSSSSSEGGNGATSTLPWHARYIAIMPGEFLQLATRDEVPAAVHRVVAAKGGARPRWSAPVLIRGRPGITFDTERYLGGSLGNPLLEECDGKTMEEIHSATQPSPSPAK